MPNFLKGSVLIAFLTSVFNAFNISYKNSKLCRAVNKIGYVWTQSSTQKTISHYINKKPYFINSITYRVIRAVVRGVDKLMGAINRTFTTWLNNSGVCYELKEVGELDSKIKTGMLALFILSVCVGFLTGKIALGENSTQMLVSVWCVFLFGVVLLGVSKYREIIKNSLICRVFKWLVKM